MENPEHFIALYKVRYYRSIFSQLLFALHVQNMEIEGGLQAGFGLR